MTALLRNRKVLVLNRGWSAIGVVTLERAIVMLFSAYKDGQPKAKIIDPTKDFQSFTWEDWGKLKPQNGEETIRGTNMIFRIPEVILLSKYDKLPQHKIHFSRRTIYKRDDNRCCYCGGRPGTELLTIDHIVPRSRGGKTTWTNCCLACVKCNSKKANRTPDEAGMKFFDSNYAPTKPKITLFRGDVRIKSWESFIGSAYWETTLENDNKE